MIKVNHLSSKRNVYIQVQEEEMGKEESNLSIYAFFFVFLGLMRATFTTLSPTAHTRI